MHLHNVLLHLLLLILSGLQLLLAKPTPGTNTGTTNNIATVIASNIANVTNSSFFVAKDGCQAICGGMKVPYPFGIGNDSTGCSISTMFQLTCDTSFDPPRLKLGELTVLSFSQTQLWIRNTIAAECNNPDGNLTFSKPAWTILEWEAGLPYTFSHTANRFAVIGCNVYALISWWDDEGRESSTGCLSVCSNSTDVIAGNDWNGNGCCQTSIPKGFSNFEIFLGFVGNHTQVLSFDPCLYAFLGDLDNFQFNGVSDFYDTSFMNRTLDNVPLVLDYVIGNQTCLQAQNSSAYSCQNNTSCIDSTSGYGGYLCRCLSGYAGNPYLKPGCTDIDECLDPELNDCDHEHATCINTPGYFTCFCYDHYSGHGRIDQGGCIRKTLQILTIIWLSIGLSFGFVIVILIGGTCIYSCINRRKVVKLRAQFFKKNRGLLMQQKISSIDTSVEPSKFFTVEELKKATNNYAENQIIGHGGYSVVYKGILSDQRTIAIKKSKVMDANQVEQFIHELLIVTQVNHRNVVKLLGCCFETEVPELVYEYIPNGTLFQHIHKLFSSLTLGDRLRIAAEAAGALFYLHSAASIPIIHRDIKSANILLDANFVAKVADFGASKLIPLDQTQVSTLVIGTLGYLDPEYFHTSQLNEKSDVYSFGVVLAELMTGKKPICLERSPEERNLATYFIKSMKENRLYQILEPRVVKDGTLEQLQAIAELVKTCLCVKSEERPAMKEVVAELERLRHYRSDPSANQQSHEESESLLSDEARTDLYALSISHSIGSSDIAGRHRFSSCLTFPFSKSSN